MKNHWNHLVPAIKPMLIVGLFDIWSLLGMKLLVNDSSSSSKLDPKFPCFWALTAVRSGGNWFLLVLLLSLIENVSKINMWCILMKFNVIWNKKVPKNNLAFGLWVPKCLFVLKHGLPLNCSRWDNHAYQVQPGFKYQKDQPLPFIW